MPLSTQAVAVLFRDAPALAEVGRALALFEPEPATPKPHVPWQIAAPGFRVDLAAETGGRADVDVVPHAWPDRLDDPTDAETFAAFGLGAFGPFATAFALARAADFSFHEPRRFGVPPAHRAFVRLRTVSAEGAPRTPSKELEALASLSAELLSIDGAVAVFHPGADLLFSPASFLSLLAVARREPREWLPLMTNVRALRGEGWGDKLLFDTFGMEQLGLVDHEAWFAEKATDPRGVPSFLRAMCELERRRGLVVKTGETAGGPAGTWKVTLRRSTWGKPREVRHWELVGPPP